MTEDAARARDEAARQRATARALRLEVRRRARASETRRSEAVRIHRRAQRLRSAGVPTAWSSLRWSTAGDDLNDVLELVA